MDILKHPVVGSKHLPEVDCKKLSYQHGILLSTNSVWKQMSKAQTVNDMKMQFSSSCAFCVTAGNNTSCTV
jgi:hypothetical protein